MKIVCCDIGGTHARFCTATVGAGSAAALNPSITLKTADYPTFADAFDAFARHSGGGEADGLAIAFAGPVGGSRAKLTNSAWTIDRAGLADRLGIARLTIVNDFGAVAHAVAALDYSAFRHLGGPDAPLPDEGVISVVGPGTGLGSAMLLQRPGGDYRVIETEGGHMTFAPVDEAEIGILDQLRGKLGRVSVERIASGPGLALIYAGLGGAGSHADDTALWSAAIDGSDRRAAEALDLFCKILGSAAGDLALAQGAKAVVIAGGVGRRLADRLPASGFAERFAAKGRFRAYMEAVPVKLVTHPEPGLLGVAAAFAQEHR